MPDSTIRFHSASSSRKCFPQRRNYAVTSAFWRSGCGCLRPMGIMTKPCKLAWRYFVWLIIASAIRFLSANWLQSLSEISQSRRPIGFCKREPFQGKSTTIWTQSLAFEDHIGEYTSAIKSERAFGLETFRNLPSRNFWLFHRGRLNRWESLYLHEMQALLDLSCDPRPFRDTIQVIHHINTTVMPDNGAKGPSEKEPAPNTVGFVLEIFPGMQAIHTCVARTRAMIRSLRVLNALQTHATTSSNKIPKLAELGLPPQTTTDPFTGEPLHVKKTPKGWLVYSVGPNFQDDGGKLDDFNNGDVGVGPPLPAAKTVAPAKKQNSDLVPSRKSDSR